MRWVVYFDEDHMFGKALWKTECFSFTTKTLEGTSVGPQNRFAACALFSDRSIVYIFTQLPPLKVRGFGELNGRRRNLRRILVTVPLVRDAIVASVACLTDCQSLSESYSFENCHGGVRESNRARHSSQTVGQSYLSKRVWRSSDWVSQA